MRSRGRRSRRPEMAVAVAAMRRPMRRGVLWRRKLGPEPLLAKRVSSRARPSRSSRHKRSGRIGGRVGSSTKHEHRQWPPRRVAPETLGKLSLGVETHWGDRQDRRSHHIRPTSTRYMEDSRCQTIAIIRGGLRSGGPPRRSAIAPLSVMPHSGP
jgi:hypothetical protein